ncbi:hypothetical protein GGE12_001002 [Rhizobium mongolense]|uniref:Uncharacterized protein n=1 Tax=Rhizobium mongolense TaxID=57676 RepID=A0A7W6WD81_9HYPH|nr:hypothetical protein [Rhizobium mongolense]
MALPQNNAITSRPDYRITNPSSTCLGPTTSDSAIRAWSCARPVRASSGCLP